MNPQSSRRRPRIWIVTRRHERKGKWVDYVAEQHVERILRFGGVPVVLPRVEAVAGILDAYGPMDGLLLVEGEDIDPARYGGGEGHVEKIEPPDPARDAIEFELVRRADASGAAYLGICRGCQLFNVHRGGTVYADVMADLGSPLKHTDAADYHGYRHPVRIEPGTPLAAWFGAGDLRVNSYHHQGVKRLGKGLQVMARTPDGLVEAYYDPSRPFVVGLQFHPERMEEENPACARVFEAFLAAAAAGDAPRRHEGHEGVGGNGYEFQGDDVQSSQQFGTFIDPPG